MNNISSFVKYHRKKMGLTQKELAAKAGVGIRFIREKQGLSQESVAFTSGLDRSYYGGVERGEHNVAVVNLEKIANALDVGIKDFFGKR